MAYGSFIIVIDIPSIKKYVFGTDSLNEVRGASARLDRLNRVEMRQHLHEYLGKERVDQIYANGGSAQFLAHECDDSTVRKACTSLSRHIREQTCGEVRVTHATAQFKDEASYQEAVSRAHFQMRCQREFATCHRSASLMPTMMECESASHLPAAHIVNQGAEGIRLLSEASYQKGQEGRETHRHGLWDEWMRYLRDAGSWPEAKQWNRLRCKSMTDIGAHSRNAIGMVYADGNAMGQIVQALDRPETFRQFSSIVDDSIREACFTVLGQISQPEVDKVRKGIEQDLYPEPLAADILLLGGDDLLVAVPADRALDFALRVTALFERRTQEKIAALRDAKAQKFFADRLGDQGFTLSCGIAIAKGSYPFYLSLDLAEQLLRNAKRKDRHSSQLTTQGAARIDFHVVTGANSHALTQVREEDYRVTTHAERTLRPLSHAQLEKLRISVRELHESGFPRSKLHELQEAALATEERQADWLIRDVFVRCQHGQERSQRRALWQAVSNLCPPGYTFDFPWFEKSGHRLLCMADIVDAYDLFRQ